MSTLLLVGFPVVILAGTYIALYFITQGENGPDVEQTTKSFLSVAPIVAAAVGIWFLIAFSMHSKMISMATGSKPLERKNNKKIYNMVENLCMSQGMKTPKINIMESNALNAFASGINDKTYTVTLTRGIINHLEDDELEGVIAHELMHIRNRDVRLLIISIIFVGILSFVMQIAFRSVLYGGMGRSRKKEGNNNAMLVILIVSIVAYFLTILFKFALSRKREYMADAGAAQMTKNPMALAGALRKISGNHKVDDVKSEDVEQMFIENQPGDSKGFQGLSGLFATHPPIEKRIAFLERL